MDDRRLVGIDLGIASAHTVRVLAGDGSLVCRRKATPTVESLAEVEQAALAGVAPATHLEVVVEPTGSAWLPIAVFFSARGHTVYRVSSAKAHDLRRVLSRHAKSNGIDADTLARLPLVDPAGLHPSSCQTRPGRRWTAACGLVTGSPARPPATSAASRTWSSSCCQPAP
jgi:transposase